MFSWFLKVYSNLKSVFNLRMSISTSTSIFELMPFSSVSTFSNFEYISLIKTQKCTKGSFELISESRNLQNSNVRNLNYNFALLIWWNFINFCEISQITTVAKLAGQSIACMLQKGTSLFTTTTSKHLIVTWSRRSSAIRINQLLVLPLGRCMGPKYVLQLLFEEKSQNCK